MERSIQDKVDDVCAMLPFLPHLRASWLASPLGPLLAVADSTALRLLAFSDQEGVAERVLELGYCLKSTLYFESNAPLQQLTEELAAYFKGQLRSFETPLQAGWGTPFQQSAWTALKSIPYGKTWSYAHQAQQLGQPRAVRALGNANAANPLSIVVPCHRVIQSSGKVGGYAGSPLRKAWLLTLEAAQG